MKRYLAYGSNLNIPQMLRRCPDARVIGTAVIPDYRLLFKGSRTGSYLTIEPAQGSSVPVAVWEVSEADEAALDRYEGYPSYYYKKYLSVPVQGPRGRLNVRGMVYIMTDKHLALPPTDAYYGIIEEGYERFHFDRRVLRQALDDAIYAHFCEYAKTHF